eukprot:1178918-Prorocentrum_minimum.AAC.2
MIRFGFFVSLIIIGLTKGRVIRLRRSSTSARAFPQWTNQMQEAWVYSHDGPIRRRKRGYIPTADSSV